MLGRGPVTDNNQSTHSSAGGPAQHHGRGGDAVPEAEIKTSRGISIVWLVPLVAAVIGIWLAYTTLQERGPTITITFDTPMSANPGKPSPENTAFTLYDSYESVTQAGFTTKVPYLVQFDESVRGLSQGAPVEFRGMRVGTVSDVGLQIDVATESIRIPVI